MQHTSITADRAATPRTARADLHVHSRYSDHPSEWFLRRIGAPESFVEPRDIYQRCRERGMDFVTITDHNEIRGALEIADLPGTFLSAEVTTYFPEDGCKIHCLVHGISEAQFARIQELRANIYDLRDYLLGADIAHGVAHPLFRVNGKLTVEHVEKLLLLFNTFEGVNGARHPRASEIEFAIFRNLTPELMTELAARHGIRPAGAEPWRKRFTGGSVKLPEYEAQSVVFPPYLDMLRFFEKEKFSEIIISTPGPVGLVALAAGRLLGVRVSGIYHTDFPLFVRYLTRDEVVEGLTWRYMQWFFGQLDTVFVPSDYYRQSLAEKGFAPERLVVMPRGVDTSLYSPRHRTPAYWDARGVPSGFRFLYVGRVSSEKNVGLLVDTFLEQFASRPGVSLLVVGDGPLLPELRQRCTGRPVHFTGCLRGEELVTAYASADAFVFPSTTDTFGNVVLEAQACGLPAIVSDRGGPQEVVRRHDSGLVVDLTVPGALGSAMQRLLGDPTLCAALRERGLRNAQDSSWESVLDGLWFDSDKPAAQELRRLYRHLRPDPDAAGALALDVA